MYSGQDTLAGGFPHSEIRGSKLTRSSPRLIAACHVLHRLSVPRHPPDALKTLDLSVPRAGAMPPPAFTDPYVARQDRPDDSQHFELTCADARLRITNKHGMKPSRPCRLRKPWTSCKQATIGHKNPIYVMQKHAANAAANRRRHGRTAENRFTPDPFHHHARQNAPALASPPKLVEADGIEPTTSSLQS